MKTLLLVLTLFFFTGCGYYNMHPGIMEEGKITCADNDGLAYIEIYNIGMNVAAITYRCNNGGEFYKGSVKGMEDVVRYGE